MVASIQGLPRGIIAHERMIEAFHVQDGLLLIRDREAKVSPQKSHEPKRKPTPQFKRPGLAHDREMTLVRLEAELLATAAAVDCAYGMLLCGWTGRGGSVAQVPNEQHASARIVDLRQAGLSRWETAVDLSAEGHRIKRGGQRSSETVSRILSRTAIAQKVAN